jgi:hypothetical protein
MSSDFGKILLCGFTLRCFSDGAVDLAGYEALQTVNSGGHRSISTAIKGAEPMVWGVGSAHPGRSRGVLGGR